MERFITLNLQNASGKAETENPSKPADKGSEALGKSLNRTANMAAHKAARDYARSSSGIFSK